MLLAVFAVSAAVAVRTSVPVNRVPPSPSTTNAERAYAALSDIARRTCVAPQAESWAWSANGSAQAHVDIDRLKKVLGSAGLALGAGGGYRRWSGPLQRDVGSALSARNDCAAKVFVAMVQNLPLREITTGKPLRKPSEPTQAYQQVVAPPSNMITESGGSHNSNGAGQQLNSGERSTNVQIGGPTANGGPAIQNNYFPPVTADQKQQAHDALMADLSELARYPERGALDPGPSIVQHHFKYKVARALYVLLSKYNYTTISTVPGGSALNDFESAYYEFEKNAPLFEQNVLNVIGVNAPQKFPIMWRDLYEYCLVRSFGYTPEQYAATNGQPNFDITAEQQEALYQKLKADPRIGPGLQANAEAVNLLTNTARALLQPFQAH